MWYDGRRQLLLQSTRHQPIFCSAHSHSEGWSHGYVLFIHAFLTVRWWRPVLHNVHKSTHKSTELWSENKESSHLWPEWCLLSTVPPVYRPVHLRNIGLLSFNQYCGRGSHLGHTGTPRAAAYRREFMGKQHWARMKLFLNMIDNWEEWILSITDGIHACSYSTKVEGKEVVREWDGNNV